MDNVVLDYSIWHPRANNHKEKQEDAYAQSSASKMHFKTTLHENVSSTTKGSVNLHCQAALLGTMQHTWSQYSQMHE